MAKLQLIDAFVLEVVRYNPIYFIGNYGRAKKDFVIESKSGNYQVREGELMASFAYGIHRDKDVFEEPYKFKVDRDREAARCKYISFGMHETEANLENWKCPAHGTMLKVLKIFVVHLTRCAIDFNSDTSFTGKSTRTSTDVPIVLNKFVYNKK